MKTTKKILVLLCVICCLSSMPIEALAESSNENAVIETPEENQIRMTTINDMDAQLYISSGTASVYAYVRGY